MFSLIKNIFGPKAAPASPAPPARVLAPRLAVETGVALPKVETASLQLAAIVGKFSDELKQLVLKQPPAEAMVALPLPTVLKYLPTGSVKMSLASVVRQAPAGTFSALPAHDKRMVEVPLGEIFKRVNPAILRKREDQRLTSLAKGDVDIFGDQANPHALTPRFAEQEEPAAFIPPPDRVPPPERPEPLAIKMPAFEPVIALPEAIAPPIEIAPVLELKITPNFSFEPEPLADAATSHAPAPESPEAPLTVALRELITAWPEPFRSEALSLDGARVSLPSERVSAGLARGKVTFSWDELRSWTTPPPLQPTTGAGETELTLPLRVLAPAFLDHSRPTKRTARKVGIDESIPDLFSGESGPPLPRREPLPAVPPAVEFASEPVLTLEAPAAEAEPTAGEFRFADDAQAAPATEEPPVALVLDDAPSELESRPSFEALAALPDQSAADPSTRTLGDVFGLPEQESWSPGEVVERVMQLPGVEGAIVALGEGLAVAHQLPTDMRGEIFAAFLPQIFARLGQYGAEMQLGAIEEVTIAAGGRDCRLFKVGTVYFGVLTTADAPINRSDLRLCAAALTVA